MRLRFVYINFLFTLSDTRGRMKKKNNGNVSTLFYDVTSRKGGQESKVDGFATSNKKKRPQLHNAKHRHP